MKPLSYRVELLRRLEKQGLFLEEIPVELTKYGGMKKPRKPA